MVSKYGTVNFKKEIMHTIVLIKLDRVYKQSTAQECMAWPFKVPFIHAGEPWPQSMRLQPFTSIHSQRRQVCK